MNIIKRKRKQVNMLNQQFPVATLSNEQLTKIKNFEEQLRQETSEEIILVAYKNEKHSGTS
jgi:hypothetical protein